MFHLTKEEKLVIIFIVISVFIGNIFIFVSKKSPYLKNAFSFIENYQPADRK